MNEWLENNATRHKQGNDKRKSKMVKHLRSTRGSTAQKKRAVVVSNLPGDIKNRLTHLRSWSKTQHRRKTLDWETSCPQDIYRQLWRSREFDSYWIALGIISHQEPGDAVSMIACLEPTLATKQTGVRICSDPKAVGAAGQWRLWGWREPHILESTDGGLGGRQ